ncbi:multipass membrane protein [Candidatus Mancarchaeum acidiphilum]|uniref:Multipass membrane protein n=1 Tax=Candidatus Mancarchaeum acidiphilum TaxID=1920749 RepID=A0A218NMX7_9ARCH|nr:hypothetical protein [Candidatus Mancarchaeum acidiphilum]ASI13804.1 multipass membrane protein [Candidatus Mancarchaeum acidiphilum]
MQKKEAFEKPSIIWGTIIIIVLAVIVIALFSNILRTQPIEFGVSEGVSYMGFGRIIFTGQTPLNATSTPVEVAFVNYGEASFIFILISIVIAFIALFTKKASIIAAISSFVSFALGIASLYMFSNLISISGEPVAAVAIPGAGIYLMLFAGIILVWAYYLFSAYDINALKKSAKEAAKPAEVEAASENGPNKAEDIKKQISEEVSKEMTSKKETETENKITLKN